MIPQLAALPAVSPTPGTASVDAASADDGSAPALSLVFGDLLDAINAGGSTAAPVTGLPPVSATPASEALSTDSVSTEILALLAGLELEGITATPLVAGDWTDGKGAEDSDALRGLLQMLSQDPLSMPESAEVATAMADSLAATRSQLPSALSTLMESRMAGSDALVAASTGSGLPAASALSASVLEVLQSLLPSGQPTAAADAGNGNALAATLQPTASERLLEASAGRPPAPLPPQDLRATVSQTLEQVAWMSQEGVHRARLQLEPAHLGRVDIWLDIEGGEARLHLGAQQVQVREALEAVLPRLRDALAEHGMTLTDASVSHSGRDDASRDTDGGPADRSSSLAEEAGAIDHDDSRLRGGQPSGMLDLYA